MKIKEILASAVVLACISSGSTSNIYLDSSCTIWGSSVNYVDNYDTYWIHWDGNSVPGNCELHFQGGESSYDTDGYKICVDVISYNMYDCNVKLKYYSDFDFVPDRTYSCNDYPSSFCATSDEDLYIGLSKSSPLKPIPGSFELKVTATKVYSEGYAVTIGWSVGASVTVIVSVFVVILIVRNRRRRPGVLIASVNQGPQSTVITSSTNLGYNQPVVSPPPYPGTTPPAYNSYPGYPNQTGPKY